MSEDIGTILRTGYAICLIAFLTCLSLTFFVVGSTYLKEETDDLEQNVTSVRDGEISGLIINEEEGSINVVREPRKSSAIESEKSSVVEPLSWKVILDNIDTPDVLLSYEVSNWVYWTIGFIFKMTLVSLLAGFIVPIIAYKISRLFGGQEYESEHSSN